MNDDLDQARQTFQSQLNVVAGVIKEGETNHLSKLLYRMSRGKVVAFFKNIGTGINDEFRDLDSNYGRGMGSA